MQAKEYFFLFKRIPVKHIALDLLIIAASLYLSLYLRVGDGPDGFSAFSKQLTIMLPLVAFIRIACLIGFRCYLIMWRYISIDDASRIAKALALSGLLIVAISFFLPVELARLPRPVYVIDSVLVALGLMGVRLLRRFQFESGASRQSRAGQKTLIYGSGHNGRLLAQRFKTDPALGINLVGFIDDDPKKQSMVISGVAVLGSVNELSELIEKLGITQVIVAIPNISGESLRRLVQETRKHNIRPRITSSLTREGDTNRNLAIYREIELSDLLNRQSRNIDLTAVRDLVQGKRVLITGAGGSIGSEIARQVFSLEPSRLLLLDHSEYNLYEIDKELRVSTQDMMRVVPLMVDLKDEHSVTAAMKEYAPEIVFHAAAYKHVHLVESNPCASILNNVLGTRNLLRACEEIGVETFVQISTDKAVNPAGVMGATKRCCELMVTSQGIRTGKMYCSVRFGNVLGSSGSLIPLLQKQIAQGGPVTVTHPDMTRYFMLIPEAVSLVLIAATLSRTGDINVLKMGEPIRIVDVARSLITLCGKTEDEIPIVFTGLRPGEKMFEELYIRGDELKTEHPDILILPYGDSQLHSQPDEIRKTEEQIERMISHARQGSKEALYELNQLVKSKYLTAGSKEATESKVAALADYKHRN